MRDWLEQVIAHQGIESVVADELALLPGAEELTTLLAVEAAARDGAYDLVVVDCAPTDAALRLLTLPELAHGALRVMLRLQRALASEIEADRVRLLTVSIDPRRDRLTDLAEYRLRYTKDISGWDIGRPQDQRVLDAWLMSFGVVAIPEPVAGIAHNAAIHVVAPNGRLVAIYDLGDIDSAASYVRDRLDNPA